MATLFPKNIDAFKTYASDGTLRSWIINNLQDAVKAMQSKIGINNATDGSSLDHCFNNFVKTGRKIWIYQDTGGVPTGWTALTPADNVLAVKGAYLSVYENDGSDKGTWSIIGLSHTHNPGTFTINTQHYHNGPTWIGEWDYGFWNTGNYFLDYQGSTTSPISGVSSYGTANVSTWRPKAAVGLIIRKN